MLLVLHVLDIQLQVVRVALCVADFVRERIHDVLDAAAGVAQPETRVRRER